MITRASIIAATSDATSAAAKILKGYAGYVKGSRTIGTYADYSITNSNIYASTASYDKVIVPNNTYQWTQTGIDMSKDWIAYARIQFLENDDFLHYEFWIDATVQLALTFGRNWVTATNDACTVSTYDYIDTAQKVLIGESNFYSAPKKIMIWYDAKWGYLNVYVDNVLMGSHKPAAGDANLADVNVVKIKTGNGVDVQCTFDYQYMAYPLVVAIGDSITEGQILHSPDPDDIVGVDNYASNYCKLVSDYLQAAGIRNYFVVNKGVGSNTTTQMEARYAADVTATGCKYVLIHGGINDYAGADTSVTTGKKATMAAAAVTAGAKPLVLGVTPTKAASDAYEYAIALHAAELAAYGIYDYVDLWDAIEGATADTADNDLMADNVHPNATGYAAIASAITDYITA